MLRRLPSNVQNLNNSTAKEPRKEISFFLCFVAFVADTRKMKSEKGHYKKLALQEGLGWGLRGSLETESNHHPTSRPAIRLFFGRLRKNATVCDHKWVMFTPPTNRPTNTTCNHHPPAGQVLDNLQTGHKWSWLLKEFWINLFENSLRGQECLWKESPEKVCCTFQFSLFFGLNRKITKFWLWQLNCRAHNYFSNVYRNIICNWIFNN